MSDQSEPGHADAPQRPHADDHPVLVASNARAGLWFFGAYLLFYAGFVGLSAFAPEVMARSPFGGLNLAVIYGFGLIVAAFVLALGYMAVCHGIAGRHAKGGHER